MENAGSLPRFFILMAEQKFLALYRKYRPQTFEDVRGRDAIVRTLKNQIINGRVSHSYLFAGTRGTGKTTIAKIFAKAVNCEHPHDGNPCGECEMCRAIAEDRSFNVVEMDAASNNSVEDIRKVIDEVSYSPSEGKKRVYIIDEVHMLSGAAFNALLKTLEEPPEYAVFILCTTEPNRLPVTILSRCQRFDFGRLTTETIAGRLREVADAEHLEAEDRALHYIAGAADGSMRDGLSLLDQCNAFNYGAGELTYERTLEILGAVDPSVFSTLFRLVHDGKAAEAVHKLDELLMQGRELVRLITDFIWYLRNLMLLKASEDTAKDLDVSGENLTRMIEDERKAEMPEIQRDIRMLSELTEQIRFSSNRRILAEAGLIRLCRPQMDTDTDALRVRVQQVERLMAERDRYIAQIQQTLQNPALMAALSGAGQPGSMPGQVAGSGAAGAAGTAGTGAGMPGGAGLSAGMPSADGRVSGSSGSGVMAGSAAAAPSAGPVLPKAIPEEVREIARNWPKILASMPDNYIRVFLGLAKLSCDEQGNLVFVFDNPVTADTFTNKEHEKTREAVLNHIRAQTGKDVSVVYKCLDNHEKFTDNYVDLSDVVKMEIEPDDSL